MSAASSLHSAPARLFGSRSKTRSLRWWALCWRAGFVVIMIGASALDLYSERLTYLAITEPAATPQERYDRIAYAVRWFPMDRNLRWEPEIFRALYNNLAAEVAAARKRASP